MTPNPSTEPPKAHDTTPGDTRTDQVDAPTEGTSQGELPIDVVVVGAGIGGLLSAVLAAHRGLRVMLLESQTSGGRARADKRGAYLFNRGPRALYCSGPADQVLRTAGVNTSHGAGPALVGAGARHAGTMHRFPGTATDTARTRLLSMGEKVTLARTMAAIMSGIDGIDHLSVTEWMDHRGLTGTVRQLVEALVRLTSYANAPDRLAAGPALHSVRAGIKPGVRYLDGGWQSLVDQLTAIAQSAGVQRCQLKVQSVSPGNSTVVVCGSNGERLQARSVILATGGPGAVVAALGARPASWPPLGSAATVACLELGLRTIAPRPFVLGIDEPTYLSTHCPPARLAPEGHSVVHVMRYQTPDDELDATATRECLDGVVAAAGIDRSDVMEERFLARMVVTGAVPVPDSTGALGRASVTVAEHPGVFLVGDWVGSSGMLADAVAASATEATKLVAQRCATMVQ